MTRLIHASLGLALVLAASTAAHAQSQVPDKGQVERGRTAFVENGCFRCHGYVGQGSQGTGPALAGVPWTYEAIDAYIRSPAGEMPPYSKKILSDSDVKDIAAFIGTLKGADTASR